MRRALAIAVVRDVAPVLFPVINRSQDLSPVAEAAETVEAGHPVALWRPDLPVLTEFSSGRGRERRITELGREFGLTVERRIDLPAPQGRSYAILSLPVR